MLDREWLAAQLAPLAVECFDQLDSTNSYARRVFAERAGSFIVTADRQTAGRGRQGRSFASPGGGVYFSLALKPDRFPAELPLVTVVAAVAVRRALASLFGVPARIKWVNDIYIHNKKVCGILTELLSGTDGRPSGLIVGIGINLAVRAFPPELPYAGAVGEFAAADVPYERVVACVLRALFDCFALPPEQLVGEYRRHNLLLGRRIRFPYAGRLREGVAADIDSCGCLVADCGGEQITLSSNDISVEWDREG